MVPKDWCCELTTSSQKNNSASNVFLQLKSGTLARLSTYGEAKVSQKNNTPAILIIGGSDSGGGAGIQADLRVMNAYGIAGACAITGATAQNTAAVRALNLLAPSRVAAQIDAVLDDISIAAIKIGMLGSVAIARVVASRIRNCEVPIVLDPVLIATSGGALLSSEGLNYVRNHLLPLCTVLTPNLPEAAALIGRPLHSLPARLHGAQSLIAMGAASVLIKGGHARGKILTDLFVDASGHISLTAQRLRMRTHGTGCTFASAFAAELSLGRPPAIAARRAHRYLQSALQNPLRLGISGVCSPGSGVIPDLA
jgi:hydroxymethylpyrimidine/phosphomethylpyrimidine kinase